MADPKKSAFRRLVLFVAAASVLGVALAAPRPPEQRRGAVEPPDVRVEGPEAKPCERSEAGTGGTALSLGDQGQPRRDWSTTQWAAWRDGQIERILAPTPVASGGSVLQLDDVHRRCADAYYSLARLSPDANFLKERSLENFAAFVHAQSRLADRAPDGSAPNSLGYEVSDRSYWMGASPYLTFPPLLQSQALFNLLARRETYGQAMTMISDYAASLPEERRWVILGYRSQFLLSADKTTYGRLLVVVPNEPLPDGSLLDRWIQFALATSDVPQSTVIRSVSMVAVKHQAGKPSQTWLADFMRMPDSSSGAITPEPRIFVDPEASGACYNCHKTGVLPIHPAEIYTSASPIPSLNARIAGYGPTDFGPLDTEAYGPSIGESAHAETEEDIRRWSGDATLTPAQCARVRQSMICATCHNSVAKLDFPLGIGDEQADKNLAGVFTLGKTYVESGWMPPDNALTAQERKALWRCVRGEYFDPAATSGRFVDWLRR